jgi:hypothetical protein
MKRQLILLRHNQLYLRILRSLHQQASRRTRPEIGARGPHGSRRQRSQVYAGCVNLAAARLLTMRVYRRSKSKRITPSAFSLSYGGRGRLIRRTLARRAILLVPFQELAKQL